MVKCIFKLLHALQINIYQKYTFIFTPNNYYIRFREKRRKIRSNNAI